jgi:soluble lytic murein transglycosylase-like protein
MRILLLFSLLLLSMVAHGEMYIYEEKDGTRWFTDKKLPKSQYTFIDKYGRPTATKSCKGMTPAKLEVRADRYAHIIDDYATRYRIDPLLLKAVIRVESCFDRRAVSRAGAEGLMQLMPATADELGVLDSFNAYSNIAGGTKYLSQMLKRFNNNLEHALAAYNAGPRNVTKYNGIPPFKETQNYVKRIKHFHQTYRAQVQAASAN